MYSEGFAYRRQSCVVTTGSHRGSSCLVLQLTTPEAREQCREDDADARHARGDDGERHRQALVLQQERRDDQAEWPPLGTPSSATGASSKARTIPIFAGECVVTSTNHGSATFVIAEPTRETSSASSPRLRRITPAPLRRSCATRATTPPHHRARRTCRSAPRRRTTGIP